MKTDYSFVRNLFVQKGLIDAMLNPVLQVKLGGTVALDAMKKPEFEYLCWRYVFAKDITNKAVTNKLLKLGFDNLSIVEIVNTLNNTRELVEEIKEDSTVKK